MYRADARRTLLLRGKHVLLRAWYRHVKRQYLYSIFSFDSFTQAIPAPFVNEPYYFDDAGNAHCDVYLRYESLQTDFDALCHRLGIAARPLPRVNTRHVTQRRHYRSYYDDATRERVAKRFEREIEHFGYAF
jgi:hypothetical protein